jgi:lipoate-protein ligase A
MLYIHNPSRNPFFNLALEEYALRELPRDEEYFMLWQNDPAIIIGAGQNTMDEIDPDYVRQKKIHVVRRRSGGGAVYHDRGNLNFSFVVNRTRGRTFDFQRFTVPVIRALRQLGIGSAFSSRNDLVIGTRKFSGNAQYVAKDRLLHHGTLLVQSNLNDLEKALSVSGDKIKSKGVQSVRNRVVNISEHLGERIPMAEFKAVLLDAIAGKEKAFGEYCLTGKDLQRVHVLMRTRYLRWDWNFKSYGAFDTRRSQRFPAGKVETRLRTAHGKIQGCKFYGDYFGHGDPADVEQLISGHRRDRHEIRDLLESLDVDHYFHGIGKEGLLDLIA